MELGTAAGILVPLLGTTLGSACVFFMRGSFGKRTERLLTGFAGGVMTAASVWSLLIPATERCRGEMGQLAFIPPAVGFMLGVLLIMLLDISIQRFSADTGSRQDSVHSEKSLMFLAITLHNIPEGMVVGLVYAGLIYGSGDITPASAAALAIGIAIQNFPEGAIISMPLHAGGLNRRRAFAAGAMSGAVEPVAALITLAAAGLVIPAVPYLLSFAAGAMIYVVAQELIPGTTGDGSHIGAVSFAAGFTVMMMLDVALG